jgi:ABC-type amino acid transport substrate-binding protein
MDLPMPSPSIPSLPFARPARWRNPRTLLRVLAIVVLLPVLWATDGQQAVAQTADSTQPLPDRELVVATKEAAPFAMKAADGSWSGISIDLWRRVAEQLHWRYRVIEVRTVEDLLDAVTHGTADVAVAAITVTAARARNVDFTQPFYETGLGVGVRGGLADWIPVLHTFLSFNFLQAILVLLGIALTVGILVWFFERRGNDNFAGHPAKGVTSGIWWSAVAMTQAGAAQGGPASLPGRLLAVVWMIASIIVIAVFTASVTSAITAHRLQGLVRNTDDLRSLRVGVIGGSSSSDFLDNERIAHRTFDDPQSALRAVQADSIDAVVYDRPLLTWIVRRNFSGLRVLAVTFDPQNYAIALPRDSHLRAPLDVALLESIKSEWWNKLLYQYLGASGAEARE